MNHFKIQAIYVPMIELSITEVTSAHFWGMVADWLECLTCIEESMRLNLHWVGAV